MNSLKTLIFMLLVSTICLHPLRTDADEVQPGQQFTSPDGKFIAKLVDDSNGDEAIMIKDNRTGKEYPPEPTLTPVLLIKWLSDSKTLLKSYTSLVEKKLALLIFNGTSGCTTTPPQRSAMRMKSFASRSVDTSYDYLIKSL